jgi:hypothetical protein
MFRKEWLMHPLVWLLQKFVIFNYSVVKKFAKWHQFQLASLNLTIYFDNSWLIEGVFSLNLYHVKFISNPDFFKLIFLIFFFQDIEFLLIRTTQKCSNDTKNFTEFFFEIFQNFQWPSMGRLFKLPYLATPRLYKDL